MLEGTSLCFYRVDNFERMREIGLPLMLAASSPRDIMVTNFGCEGIFHMLSPFVACMFRPANDHWP